MIIHINGSEKEISGEESIASLAASIGLVPSQFAVELNGEIISNSAYDKTILKAGDSVEIVRFIGGG